MAFYQCSKCKKIWQYPINKCPDCFLDLKKIKGKKIRVISVSKVNIPTIFHPEVPYFVLVLEDEKGNKWVQKSVKEYKKGEDFVLDSSKEKQAVAIWRAKYDVLEAVEKVIDLVEKPIINQNSKILILPTLVAPKHPHFSVNTSPQFLEAVTRYLLEKGADRKNIKVASQSFNDFPIEASAQKSQLLNVCTKNTITPLDLAKTEFVKKEKNGVAFEISQELFNNDLIINLPILKLDPKLKVKGASHNIFKFLKKESYLSLVYLHDAQDLLKKFQEIMPSYLTIAEAISVQKSNAYTTFLGLVLASYNPFNIDRVFAEIAMIKDLPRLLKSIKIEDIPIIGRQIRELQYDVERF